MSHSGEKCTFCCRCFFCFLFKSFMFSHQFLELKCSVLNLFFKHSGVGNSFLPEVPLCCKRKRRLFEGSHIKRLLHEKQRICMAEASHNLIPRIVGIRSTNNYFCVWMILPDFLNGLNSIHSGRQSYVHKNK